MLPDPGAFVVVGTPRLSSRTGEAWEFTKISTVDSEIASQPDARPARQSPQPSGTARPRIRVGVIFGGQSAEHEVSLMSAASVLKAIDHSRFEVVPLAISKAGKWLTETQSASLLASGSALASPEIGSGHPENDDYAIAPSGARATGFDGPSQQMRGVDVVFPVLHGPYGEDGTVQGLLELAGIAYVGSGVLGSALGMDKVKMKEVLAYHGLPVVEWRSFRRWQWREERERVVADSEVFGYPCFVKPANLGSSIGVSKAHDRAELVAALAEAFSHDEKAIVEPAIDAREIEVSVIGNHHPRASIAGEIVPSNEFYDYAAKYLDGKSELHIPADLSATDAAEVRHLAVRAFLALECAGLARADFFLDRQTGKWFVNELNTMPGFTSISMYPKLWEASGVLYQDLISELIDLAISRWKERHQTFA